MDAQEIDRALIGLVVKREIERRGSWQKTANASDVGRATLYRVRDADTRVSVSTLRKLETALDLPYEALDHIGRHDFDQLREDGVPEALVKWAEKHATPPQQKHGRATTTVKPLPEFQEPSRGQEKGSRPAR